MTIQQIDLVFHRCDLDKDGKLSFDEFERMMKRHMVGASGLTIEESERMVEEAETDEEIEEQVIVEASDSSDIPEEVVGDGRHYEFGDDVDFAKFVTFY